jgi:hypothetical protein
MPRNVEMNLDTAGRNARATGGAKSKRPMHLADAPAFEKCGWSRSYARRLRAKAASPINRPPTVAMVAGSGMSDSLKVVETSCNWVPAVSVKDVATLVTPGIETWPLRFDGASPFKLTEPKTVKGETPRVWVKLPYVEIGVGGVNI